MDHVNRIKAAIAAAAGALTGLWGWMGWLVVGWVVCMVLDYITGSAAAGKAGPLSGRRWRR
ncbi:MAG: phage holin family protein [Lawsonibacter sp.]|nr:phage holin family protein [Lawsonibacter sp.]